MTTPLLNAQDTSQISAVIKYTLLRPPDHKVELTMLMLSSEWVHIFASGPSNNIVAKQLGLCRLNPGLQTKPGKTATSVEVMRLVQHMWTLKSCFLTSEV